MTKCRFKKYRHFIKSESGFTLNEILITLAILGVLVAIAVPVYLMQKKQADETSLETNLIAASTNIEQAKIAGGGKFPTTLTPAGKPAIAAPTTPGVVFKYTYPYDRFNYCLQGTYKGKTLFINHTTQTPTANDCTYVYVLPAPENFYASVDLTFKPKARWDKVDGAVSYNVYKEGTKVGNYTANTATLPAMTPAEEANYWVRGVNASGQETDDSNKVRLVAPIPAPSVAPVLSYSQTSNNGTAMTTTNKLAWNSVQWADTYSLYDATTNELLYSGPSTNFSIDITKNTTQKFHVIARNTTGVGPKSNVVTINPKFDTPVLNASVDDFTLRASFSWQTLASTWGTGAQAVVINTGNTISSAKLSTNTHARTVTRVADNWKVIITTGNGVVIESNVVKLDAKEAPTLSVDYHLYWQNLDSTFERTPSFYGLNSSNSSWELQVSDSPAFTKIYPQSSASGTAPGTTFSGKAAPTHGGTYYVRYVITRKADGATLVSPTVTQSVYTRMMDIKNDGNRDIPVLTTWNNIGQILLTPTGNGGHGMNETVGNNSKDPRIIGTDCVVLPVLDATAPGSNGFFCWRHQALNGYVDYYGINDSGAIQAPVRVGGEGWNMYSSLTVIQNFMGDDRPYVVGMASGDGSLQVWRVREGGTPYLDLVSRTAGTCWSPGCSRTSVIKGVYDFNGQGSVGLYSTLTASPWARYYPLQKNPNLTAAQNIPSSVDLGASWTSTMKNWGYYPTDANPNACCSYIYAREYGNIVWDNRVVPVMGHGTQVYYDIIHGNGRGAYGGSAVNWGYANNGQRGYPGQWTAIR